MTALLAEAEARHGRLCDALRGDDVQRRLHSLGRSPLG
jgi:hypothetical protein